MTLLKPRAPQPRGAADPKFVPSKIVESGVSARTPLILNPTINMGITVRKV
jgi:hypothetical protein